MLSRYAFIAPKRLNHKASAYIKPDILSILSPNPTQKGGPDLQLYEGLPERYAFT